MEHQQHHLLLSVTVTKDGTSPEITCGCIQSLRYTSWKTVSAAKMHVLEFHKGLGKAPPPMPIAEWTLRVLKHAMAAWHPATSVTRLHDDGAMPLH